jgi:superfamily II DNA/RNA helicase
MSLENLQQEFIDLPTGDKHGMCKIPCPHSYGITNNLFFVVIIGPLEATLKKANAKRTLIFCNNVASCRSTEHFLREQGFQTGSFHGDILPKVTPTADSYITKTTTCYSGADELYCRDVKNIGKDF